MPDFGDLRQYMPRDLTLTVGDKTYTIPAPNADKGLELRAWAMSGSMTEADEITAGVELCGGKWDEAKGDFTKPKGSVFAKLMREQDWATVHRVIKTALVFYGVSRERAAIFWRTGDFFEDDEPPAPAA